MGVGGRCNKNQTGGVDETKPPNRRHPLPPKHPRGYSSTGNAPFPHSFHEPSYNLASSKPRAVKVSQANEPRNPVMQ